jgi:hypothetical protein
MRLFLMHMEDEPGPRDPNEEVTFIVPGLSTKVAIAVPLGTLDAFLPILREATGDVDQPCPECGECLAVWPPPEARGQ